MLAFEAGNAEVWCLYSNVMLHAAKAVALNTFIRDHPCPRPEVVCPAAFQQCPRLPFGSFAAGGNAPSALGAAGGTDPAFCFLSSNTGFLGGSCLSRSCSSKSQVVRQKGCGKSEEKRAVGVSRLQ